MIKALFHRLLPSRNRPPSLLEESFCKSSCIFTDVLRDIDTGLIILDTTEKKVFFKNGHAVKILEPLHAAQDYEGLAALLCSDLDPLQQPGRTRSRQTIIHYEHRVLGYTVYKIPGDQRHISIFIQDITDRHRLAAIDEATEMMNNIGCLFSGIRHEIGNPLNSIKMALTVLQNNIKKYSPEEIDVYFNRISGEISKMETLLKSLKNFSMFETPRTSDVDLAMFFDNLMQLLGADIQAKKVAVRIDIAPDAKQIMVDPRALQHVTMNLLANAVDAMTETPKPQLLVRSQSRGNVILLSITDNGCGMSEELARDVFKPFFTTKPHGTGLGLVISKKMLTQMHCGIELVSEKGIGTTFHLTLPKSASKAPRGDAAIGRSRENARPSAFAC
ncbi:sensor histidine kinase [Thiovibrio frasassiensis]|uniref:histidine kinase n=1 Tax=Thiovibrio frasassiensis TaxID=2984131 RepID=A0A9X4RK40_9BACT|nr:HAMP domain-containing sensor histidine kinase [Thiovibrio frasassiensis]MDG4474681.1 HAMP domain-containing histidine kinase [Thiovibrio frasassiensis]